jgi:S1-C subfamily serine protease
MDLYNNLYDRAMRAIAGRPITTVVDKTRAIVAPPLKDLEGDAQAGLAALKIGKRPTANQIAALQAIVRAMRPSSLSNAGVIDPLPDMAQPIFSEWPDFSHDIVPFLYTVGRIDRKRASPLPADPYGTGFLVSDELFLTNHHVVTQLSGGTDVVNPGEAEIRFIQEYTAPDEPAVPVLGVSEFHSEEDAALLRLAPTTELRTRKPLVWSDTAPAESAHVAVVGYPFPDTSRNPLFMEQIFNNKLGVKRLAPGEIIGARKNSIFHDCSTLGGNSGSPVVDMKTCSVVGLHRDGFFLARNEALGTEVLRDFVAAAIGG